MLAQLQQLELTLLIRKYAQDYHLKSKQSVTELVKSWQDFWPGLVPLPHPSPRNNRWLKTNPWFETDLIPELQAKIAQIMMK